MSEDSDPGFKTFQLYPGTITMQTLIYANCIQFSSGEKQVKFLKTSCHRFKKKQIVSMILKLKQRYKMIIVFNT
jgi:hypothetical protein